MSYGRKVRCPVCGFRRPVEGDICPTCHTMWTVTRRELTRTQQACLFAVAAALFAGVVAVCVSDNYFGTDLLESVKRYFADLKPK